MIRSRSQLAAAERSIELPGTGLTLSLVQPFKAVKTVTTAATNNQTVTQKFDEFQPQNLKPRASRSLSNNNDRNAAALRAEKMRMMENKVFGNIPSYAGNFPNANAAKIKIESPKRTMSASVQETGTRGRGLKTFGIQSKNFNLNCTTGSPMGQFNSLNNSNFAQTGFTPPPFRRGP